MTKIIDNIQPVIPQKLAGPQVKPCWNSICLCWLNTSNHKNKNEYKFNRT